MGGGAVGGVGGSGHGREEVKDPARLEWKMEGNE
jgi:hypothetical protein